MIASLGIGMQALSRVMRHEHARQPGGVDDVRRGTDDWVEDVTGHASISITLAGMLRRRRPRGGYRHTVPSERQPDRESAEPSVPDSTPAGEGVGWRGAARGSLRAYLRRQATDGVHRPLGAEVRSRCPARRRLLRAGLSAALPGFAGRHPGPLLDDARRDDRLRGPRQGDLVQRPRPEPEVVALLPASRPVARRPRRRRGERAAGGDLHPREALRLQPSQVGGGVRLPAHRRPAGRRSPREADDRRAA